jgi:prevent-host-death family protein
MYKVYMQLPISDARKQLPDLVRRAQRGEVVEITVRGEVVARLLAPEADSGSAAEVLLAGMRRLRVARGRRRLGDVSTRKTDYLTRRVR